MAIYGLKPAFRRFLAPLMGIIGKLHPNTISGLAVVCAAFAGILLWQWPNQPWLLAAVPVLLFLRIAFNALDGMVAQNRGLTSARGELVNEGSDRLNDTLIFGGLALSNTVPPTLVLVALIVTLLVSYAGILPRAAGGERRYNGPGGKADRMLVMGLGVVVSLALWYNATRVVLDGARPIEVATMPLEISMWAVVALGTITILNRTIRAWIDLKETP